MKRDSRGQRVEIHTLNALFFARSCLMAGWRGEDSGRELSHFPIILKLGTTRSSITAIASVWMHASCTPAVASGLRDREVSPGVQRGDAPTAQPPQCLPLSSYFVIIFSLDLFLELGLKDLPVPIMIRLSHLHTINSATR